MFFLIFFVLFVVPLKLCLLHILKIAGLDRIAIYLYGFPYGIQCALYLAFLRTLVLPGLDLTPELCCVARLRARPQHDCLCLTNL
jgi:hypothetical protein